MGIINILDEHIANQIAAGEVVERPSSVVKELVENSVDARSTRIDVSVEEGGLRSIRIIDNGCGMDAEDCETAFFRHATSKISASRDLFHIRTLGFRGEALPSIAAVSKMEILTSARQDGLGVKLKIEDGKVIEKSDAASPRGSDITVNELFYNTPARLKYMKTLQTELGHISDYMYRLALAHPYIAFTLKHNGNTLLQSPGNGDLLQVIAAVYGNSVAKAMLPIKGEDSDYSINGYISRPELTRSNRNALSVVVNGRYIRNYAIMMALHKAYHTLLPINRFPLAVLSIHMDPSLIDVNVHPSKLEVRFSKEQELHQFIEAAARKTLGRQVLIPGITSKSTPKPAKVLEQVQWYGGEIEASNRSIERDSPLLIDPQIQSAMQGQRDAVKNVPPSVGVSGNSTTNKSNSEFSNVNKSDGASRHVTGSNDLSDSSIDRTSASRVDPVYQPLSSPSEAESTVNVPTTSQTKLGPSHRRDDVRRPTLGSTTRDTREEARRMAEWLTEASQHTSANSLPEFPQLSPVGQIHGTYIVAQNEYGLYLIDQHAAHERINYEYYYEKFGQTGDVSQPLLVPMTLEFTSSEAEQIQSQLPMFEQAGLILEPFGGQTFLVRSHPHWLPQGQEMEIIEEMVEWILSEKKGIDIAKLREKSAILCSCKASIKANQGLGLAEMESLLDRLARCLNPYTCPHGRPIVISFSTYELEKMFKRVM